MEKTLRHIEKLLREYDFIVEANLVDRAATLYDIDQSEACEEMIATEWWAGENAVAEANLSIAGGFTSKARVDQDQFQQLIIKLYKLLNEHGFRSYHATLVTSQYHKWLASRV